MSKNDMILLKIGNEADRVTVASILYKNGYEVKPVRRRKNGKSYEYFVGCKPVDDESKGGTVILMRKQNLACIGCSLQNDLEGSGAGNWLWARSPKGGIIECYLVVEGKPNPKIGAEQTIQSGIRDAIEEIAYVAHSRY